jgi:hypothetical protein
MRNVCAVHRPIPRTAERRSTSLDRFDASRRGERTTVSSDNSAAAYAGGPGNALITAADTIGLLGSLSPTTLLEHRPDDLGEVYVLVLSGEYETAADG